MKLISRTCDPHDRFDFNKVLSRALRPKISVIPQVVKLTSSKLV